VLEQTPEFPQSNASLIARGVVNRRLSLGQARDLTKVTRADVEGRQAFAESLLSRLSSDGKISILRTHDFFCGPAICSSWMNGAPALFDNNHVTVTTSRRMRKIFAPALEQTGQRSARP
jgi:hypothetical protein